MKGCLKITHLCTVIKRMTKIVFHEASKRGHADHGWLDAWHSFSFASWYDPERIHFGMLRVLNDDCIAAGMGFGKHPHDNMEIITVVTEGELVHKDSMGHEETLHTDEVQVMSAGSGLFHSEANHGREKLRLFQIWIFPELRNVAPRYAQQYFLKQDRINKLQMLVSPITGNDTGLKIHQQAWIYRCCLSAGNSITVPVHNPNSGLYIFLIDGTITAEGQQLSKRDAIGVSDTAAADILATADSDILILEVPMN
jgi:quercetin 2,3-dioxygenase